MTAFVVFFFVLNAYMVSSSNLLYSSIPSFNVTGAGIL